MTRYPLTSTLRAAAEHYIALQSRARHPDGSTASGTSRAWYPDRPLACCADIRPPSRAYPWSLMTHCRTMPHVAAELGVDVNRLRWAVRRLSNDEKVLDK